MGTVRKIATLCFAFLLTTSGPAIAQYGQRPGATGQYPRQAIDQYQREMAMAYAARQRAQNARAYPAHSTGNRAISNGNSYGNSYGVVPAGYPQVPVDPHYSAQAERARLRLMEETTIEQERLAMQQQHMAPFPRRLPVAHPVGFRRQQEDPFGENQTQKPAPNTPEINRPVETKPGFNQGQDPSRQAVPRDPFGEQQVKPKTQGRQQQVKPSNPFGENQMPIPNLENPFQQQPLPQSPDDRLPPSITPFADPPVEDQPRTKPRLPQGAQDPDPFGEGQVKPPAQVPGRDPVTSPEQMPGDIVLPPEIVNPQTTQPPAQQPPAQQPPAQQPPVQQPPVQQPPVQQPPVQQPPVQQPPVQQPPVQQPPVQQPQLTDPRSVEPQIVQPPTDPRIPDTRPRGLESPAAVPSYGPTYPQESMPSYPPMQVAPGYPSAQQPYPAQPYSAPRYPVPMYQPSAPSMHSFPPPRGPGAYRGVVSSEGLVDTQRESEYLLSPGTCPTYYLSLFGGASWLGDLTADEGSTIFADSGGGFGVALGQIHGRNLRSDLEFTYRSNGIVGSERTDIDPAVYQDLEGSLQSYAGMANLYWEFICFPRPCFKPYVGAGIGFVSVDTNFQYPSGQTVLNQPNDNDTGFAYQFMGGVNYKACRNIDLFIEYRLLKSDSIRIETVPNWGVGDFNYGSDNLFAGLRWRF